MALEGYDTDNGALLMMCYVTIWRTSHYGTYRE